MSRHPWTSKWLGPAVGWVDQGECAACGFSGPTLDFQVWVRGFRRNVLCNQCSSDVQGTMTHEGWVNETKEQQ